MPCTLMKANQGPMARGLPPKTYRRVFDMAFAIDRSRFVRARAIMLRFMRLERQN